MNIEFIKLMCETCSSEYGNLCTNEIRNKSVISKDENGVCIFHSKYSKNRRQNETTASSKL